MARRKPYFRNRRTALYLGVAAYVAGSMLLWDAYENRGRQRPYVTKLLPGA
jgi:hypothetical protein